MKDIAPLVLKAPGGLFERLALQQLARPQDGEAPPATLRPRLLYPFDIGESAAGADERAVDWIDTEPRSASTVPSPLASPAAPVRERRDDAQDQIFGFKNEPYAPMRNNVQAPPRAASNGHERLQAPILNATSAGRPAEPQARTATPIQPVSERRVVIERVQRVEEHSVRPAPPKATQQLPVFSPRAVTPPHVAGVKPKLPAHQKVSVPSNRLTAPEPTIEIHIGRIDVRAHIAASAKSPEAPAQVRDDRLAAYLARRNRGGRS